MSAQQRLLVIDDEPEFGEYVKRVAADLGFSVEVTQRASDFMELYRSFDPTVIVMDILMPQMDGIELVQWLAGNGCSARVILASGYNPRYAKAAETLAQEIGSLEVVTLQKPVRVPDLRAALA